MRIQVVPSDEMSTEQALESGAKYETVAVVPAGTAEIWLTIPRSDSVGPRSPLPRKSFALSVHSGNQTKRN